MSTESLLALALAYLLGVLTGPVILGGVQRLSRRRRRSRLWGRYFDD